MREEWGLNLLGKVLMKVGDEFRAEDARDAYDIVKEGMEKEVQLGNCGEIEI